METLVIHLESSEQAKAIKAVLKALKVTFERKKEESPYNPQFVAKILEGEAEFKAGKGTKIPLPDLWK